MQSSQLSDFSGSVKLGNRASMRFNILVVGEGKSGKSTLLSALLNKYATLNPSTTNTMFPCKRNGVKCVGFMNLTPDCSVHLFESRGFGDRINNAESVLRIKAFLLEGHRKWNSMKWNMITEQDMKRADDRIHCVFYLMSPHKVKSLDLQFLEEISSLVPVVPVVSKADSMTLPERKQCLLEVNRQIQKIAAKIGKPVIFDFKEDNIRFLAKSDDEVTDGSTSQIPGSLEATEYTSDTVDTAETLSSLLDSRQITVSTTSGASSVKHRRSGSEGSAGSSLDCESYSLLSSNNSDDNNRLEESIAHTIEDFLNATVAAAGEQHNGYHACDTLKLDLSACSQGVDELQTTRSDEEIQYGLSQFGCFSAEEDVRRSGDGTEGGGMLAASNCMERTVSTCNHSGCSDFSAPLPMVANIFAVICATTEVEGERVYPWGTVRIADEGCSDFRRLQRLLVESDHITEMIDLTHQVSIRLAAEATRSAFERPRRVSSSMTSFIVTRFWDALAGACPQRAGIQSSAPSTVTVRSEHKRQVARRLLFDLTMVFAVLMIAITAGCCLLRLLRAPTADN